MSATDERFDALIHKLESFAHKQPQIYRLQVALLATLGYAYILLIIAVTLALLVGIVVLMLNSRSIHTSAIKLVLLLLLFAFVLLRSLWVSFPPPVGLSLQHQDAPQLYSTVNQIASRLKAPKFHHILLTDEFNAAVVQRPRLGLLGWYQNYLIVGLPLMLALSPAQFQAVLAHELGHLSGNHSRFGGWIYRQRHTWYRLMEGLKQGGSDISWWIFEWFLKLYIPFFNAYSFVLARRNEYEADRCAVEITGVQNTAETLINVELKSRFLANNFWSGIYQQVKTEVAPPNTTYTAMQTAFLQTTNFPESSVYLEQALGVNTNNEDTHPCLKDRLQALGYIPYAEEDLVIDMSIPVSAAQEFLGDSLGKLLEYFNQYWQEKTATPWQQKYTEFQDSLAVLEKLDQQAETQQLTLEEATHRAYLTLDIKSEAAALPLFQEILERDANHISANYLTGEILLKQQDIRGIEYIERAIAQDIDIVISGCQLIYTFFQNQGNSEQAEVYRQRAEQHYELILKAKQERATISANDEFQPHNLPVAELEQLRQQLSRYPQITKVYLLRKVVQYFPERELYILGVVTKVSFWDNNAESENARLVNSLNETLNFPYSVFILVLNSYANIEKKFKKLPNTIIYNRDK